MRQNEKNRLCKRESTQRHSMLDDHTSQIKKLMCDSGITDPIGVMLDITGTYGRQMQIAWNIRNGMTEAEAEKKVDELIVYFDGEGKFPTHLTVWTWQQAEILMPMTSPTALESLRKLKWAIEPGQAGVIAVGRHGNSYGIVALTERTLAEPKE